MAPASKGTIPEILWSPSSEDLMAKNRLGSMRPDQAHKNLLSTDIKTRTDDEHIHEQDKQLLHTERGKLVPKKGENPALTDLKAKRQEQAEEE